MLTLPLILPSQRELSPIEQCAVTCETVVTALMAAATLAQDLSDPEREGYTMLIAAVSIPAEA